MRINDLGEDTVHQDAMRRGSEALLRSLDWFFYQRAKGLPHTRLPGNDRLVWSGRGGKI